MILLTGGYTQRVGEDIEGRAKGISAYAFRPHDGDLRFMGYAPADNPSYLITSRRQGNTIVYAVRELAAAAGAGVTAHRLEERNGKAVFTLLSEQPLEADDPCHLTVMGDFLVVAGYTSGTLHVLPIHPDGSLGPTVSRLPLLGGGPDDERQQQAHAHCVACDPRRSRLYVTDLGSDLVRVFDLSDTGTLHPLPDLNLTIPPGGGPRHIALHPNGDLAVVNCEMKAKVHLVDLTTHPLRIVTTENYLPERVADRASGAAVRLTPDGRYAYVSDRAFGVITQLSLQARKHKLRFQDTVESGGDKPRDFNLSPDGKWLVAANMQSHNLAVFAVGSKGELTHYRTVTGVPSPTCVGWG